VPVRGRHPPYVVGSRLELREAFQIRDDALRSGNRKLAAGQHEVMLCVHIPEDDTGHRKLPW
jgi:hypothetical protein